MTREEQLAYCKICKNKGFDAQKGIICKLTNEQATFVDKCPDFDLPESLELPKEEEAYELSFSWDEIKQTIIPSKNFLILPLFMYICFLVFIAMAFVDGNPFEFDVDTLILFGGNLRFLVQAGEYWRLVSANFLHGGLFHFIFNMYALIFIGFYLEPFLGKWKFILAILLTGIVAAATSMWWHDISLVSVGASGAIFGLYGVFGALLSTELIPFRVRKALFASIGAFVVYNLVYGLMKEGIDNAAHIGGFLAGLLLGFTFYPGMMQEQKKLLPEIIGLGLGISILLFGGYVLVKNTNDDQYKFQVLIENYIEEETGALAIYEKIDSLSEDDQIVFLQEKSIPAIQTCAGIVKEMSDLKKLDIYHRETVRWLDTYTQTRAFIFDLFLKSLVETTDKYDFTIRKHNANLELILKKLNGESVIPKELPFVVMDEKWQNDAFKKHFDMPEKLIFVNGRKVKSLYEVDPSQVLYIEEVDPEKAEYIYGKGAKNGALLITLEK